MKNLNKTAFSLLEILLASIIFIISVGGVFATLNAVRTPVSSKENALTAAVFGKQVLEMLRSQVNSGTYYSGCSVAGAGTVATPCSDFSLSLGTHQISSLPSGLSWPTEPSGTNLGKQQSPINTLNYTVSCGDGTGTYGSTNACDNGNAGSADIAHQVTLNINW